MICIGIDPGAKGALAVIGEDAGVYLVPFDRARFRDVLEEAGRQTGVRCCLERVGAMPGQGVTSMFRFGENFGYIQGLLEAFGIPYELVTPQKWKREFQVTGNKNSSVAVCRRLFPAVDLRRTAQCRKDDDGMAEALLMAEYARRRM